MGFLEYSLGNVVEGMALTESLSSKILEFRAYPKPRFCLEVLYAEVQRPQCRVPIGYSVHWSGRKVKSEPFSCVMICTFSCYVKAMSGHASLLVQC